MSQAFDPYRQWLGIASAGETPSYYELLGLRPLEADLGKINAAYQRQSSKLAGQLSGSQGDLAQRLMGELGEARMTLMTPTAKRAYDQALAARGQGLSTSTAPRSAVFSAANIDDMLPPAAAPQSTGGVAAPPPHAPVYAPPQGYVATPAYGAPQGYPSQGYPTTQAYPAWQPQPAAATGGHPAPGYYAAAQAAPAGTFAQSPMPAHPTAESSLPAVRRRTARRRSSGVPALIGVFAVVLAVTGGLWFYFKGAKTVAVFNPNQDRRAADNSLAKPSEKSDRMTKVNGTPPDLGGSQAKPDREPEISKPPLANRPPPPDISTTDTPTTDADMPGPDSERPVMETPAPENKPQPDKPQPDKPQPDKPEPEKPKDKPNRTETKAGPEELAAVAKLLKSARAALASRDLSKARDFLDEATIEASAPDTMSELNRVEALTGYVETFWDAARKTLSKLGAVEELEIDGTVMIVVEADENQLVIRRQGETKTFPWQKIPTKIAYYLANRWLAPDDPERNLALAAFEIVDPKGDRNQAQRLLDDAAAAKLKVEPLVEELKAAR